MVSPFVSSDLEESITAVSAVYCPHELKLGARETRLAMQLAQWGVGKDALVDLAYGAQVQVDAGSFPELYLFMHCQGGQGVVEQNAARMSWQPHSTVPVSADLKTHFVFERDFRQSSFPIESAALNDTCRQLLGYAPAAKVRFALQPFARATEALWQQLMALMRALPPNAPEPARVALREHIAIMLLTQLPHNHSAALHSGEVPRGGRSTLPLVHAAHDFMQAHIAVPSLTMGQVADAVGVGLRSLQQAFRLHQQTTPQAYLRRLRLEQVHRQLLEASPTTPVSLIDVAMGVGFFHMGRFAQYYRQAFGEAPSQTLRRARGSASASRGAV